MKDLTRTITLHAFTITERLPGHSITGLLYYCDPFQRYGFGVSLRHVGLYLKPAVTLTTAEV